MLSVCIVCIYCCVLQDDILTDLFHRGNLFLWLQPRIKSLYLRSTSNCNFCLRGSYLGETIIMECGNGKE